MGCCGSRDAGPAASLEHKLSRFSKYRVSLKATPPPAPVETPQQLSTMTHFSVSEVCALKELFKRVSNSLIKDGLIHRSEFHHAVFKGNQPAEIFFANRVFDIFDEKRNSVIEFGEFVRALSVFHPSAAFEEKAEFAFRIYDLKSTGYIDKQELTQLLVGMLAENPDLSLPEDAVKQLVEETFAEADLGKDGKIWPHEWMEYVRKYPSVVAFMTLPILRNLTKEFPSFCFSNDLETSLETQIEGQMAGRGGIPAGSTDRLVDESTNSITHDHLVAPPAGAAQNGGRASNASAGNGARPSNASNHGRPSGVGNGERPSNSANGGRPSNVGKGEGRPSQ